MGTVIPATSPDFGIDTSNDGSDAFYLCAYSSADSLYFTDKYQSQITGAQKEIYALNYGTGKVDIGHQADLRC
ncbi:hypothetical protein [Ruegeria atlantica]|uniref:hypothetical protein n=1 Tax=Ruegeria atlantica TaxID=81569 RepID=UPI00147DE6DE|nr:hypothetical protein [Ruegeria atlantica]